MSEQPDNVIRFVTREESNAQRDEVQRELSRESALKALERMREYIETNGCTGLGIAFTLPDGTYGSLISTPCFSPAGLIAASVHLQHELVSSEMSDDEED